ncbi:hypothetical protein [Geodermatophilus sp. URMC 64]
MWWAIVDVLAFLLVTGLVAALARAETARWEDRHRAHVVPRPVSPGDPGRRLRGAARLRSRLRFGHLRDSGRAPVPATDRPAATARRLRSRRRFPVFVHRHSGSERVDGGQRPPG